MSVAPDRLEVTVRVDNGGSFYLSANPHDLAHATRRMLRALDWLEDASDVLEETYSFWWRLRLDRAERSYSKRRAQVEKLIE